MAGFGDYAGNYLTMASQGPQNIERMSRLGMDIQNDPYKRQLLQAQIAQEQAQAAASQAQLPYADQMAQAKLQGTPFEQRGQDISRMSAERQNRALENTLAEQARDNARRDLSEQRKINQENDAVAVQNYNLQMKAYEQGLIPNPPEFPKLSGTQQRPATQQGPQGQAPVLDINNPRGSGGIVQSNQPRSPNQPGTGDIQLPEDLKRLPIPARNAVLLERTKERPQAESGLSEALAQLDRMSDKAKDLILNPSLYGATGATGVVTRNMPSVLGTKWKTVDNDLNSLKATNAFAMLNQLRSQSKTGGALGQVSNQEENMLANAISGLDPQMSEGDLKARLQQLRRYTEGAKERLKEAFKRTYGMEPNLKEYHTVAEKESPAGQVKFLGFE